VYLTYILLMMSFMSDIHGENLKPLVQRARDSRLGTFLGGYR
jgi:hypothetical protein